jgi:hypothetical protein
MFSFSPHSPTPDEFAELVAESLINRGSASGQLVFDRRGFALLVKGPQGQANRQIFLNNFYRDYCLSDVQKREEILLRASKVADEPTNTTDVRKECFVAHVQDRWSVEKLRLASLQIGVPDAPSGRRSNSPYMVLADHFAISVSHESDNPAVDFAGSVVDHASLDDAITAATENLRRKPPLVFESLIHADTDEMILHSSTSNEEDHVARVLLSKQIESLAVPGQHLIFLINPNYILVTGTRSERGLMYAYSELRPAQTQPRAMPPFPILLEGGRYSRYRIPKDSLWHFFFREIELRYFSNICRAQQELLQTKFNHLIQGSQLAEYELARDDDGRLFSYCAVNERAMPVLIPKTDYVYFQNRNGRAASSSLQRLLTESPGIFQETDFYPARYLMAQFPDSAQLSQIGYDARFA